MAEPVQRLRAALADYAKGDIAVDEDWSPEACSEVFAAAEITVPADRRAAVAKAFRKLPFYGGNYLLDAKRLMKVLEATNA
ncbi:hypothetical protein [Nocardia aurea]|uniref:hypothetical protein n=1 Tax=Nocardia aurea TaxID=2144174 RepID=UPI00339EC2DA